LAGAAPVEAACGSLPSSLGKVTLTLDVPASGPYRIWVRELAPTAGASGFYLQLADAGLCQVTMGSATIPVNTWTWVDYQNGNQASVVSATITAGSHTAVLSGLGHGTEIDKVELLSDSGCTPTGNGTNCTVTAVTATASPTASVSPTTSNSAVNGTPTASPAAGSGPSTPIQFQAAARRYFWPLMGGALVLVALGAWLVTRRLGWQAQGPTTSPSVTSNQQSHPSDGEKLA
jgi:hypothetical protein